MWFTVIERLDIVWWVPRKQVPTDLEVAGVASTTNGTGLSEWLARSLITERLEKCPYSRRCSRDPDTATCIWHRWSPIIRPVSYVGKLPPCSLRKS
jgi:hypothetical protein